MARSSSPDCEQMLVILVAASLPGSGEEGRIRKEDEDKSLTSELGEEAGGCDVEGLDRSVLSCYVCKKE